MRERAVLDRLRARLHADERGFTMIEVAIAMLLFGVLIVSIATTQSSTMNILRTDRHRSVAANLAAEEMDIVRATSFTNLQAGRTEVSRTVGDVEYTIVRDSQWVVGDASSSPCDAPANAEPKYLSVNVYVSWPVMSGVQPVDAHTIVTPPVGTYDEDSGHIAVSVIDRDGLPVAGAQVTLSPTPPPPTTATQMTTADGCAFFAFLPAGPFTATLSAGGYVSYQGESMPSQVASVAVGGTTSLAFDYDRASTLDVTVVGQDTGAAAPTAVSLVIGNTHLLPSGIRLVPGSGPSRQVGGLFPFADGYDIRAGTCADASPDEPAVAVLPGVATAVTLGLHEVFVTVQHDDGLGNLTPVAGVSVSASHAVDASCPSGESFALGTTDEFGVLGAALPYGTWSVSVNGIPNTVVISTTTPPADADGTWPFDIAVIQ